MPKIPYPSRSGLASRISAIAKRDGEALRAAIANDMSKNREIRELAKNITIERIKEIKQETLEELNNHPVTQELEAGARTDNISGSIVGTEGNLFSFIGFPEGSSPIAPIREILEEFFRVSFSKREMNFQNGEVRFVFNIKIPTFEDIEKVTPLPEWATGSWVRRVEESISGIQYYLYQQEKTFATSRSGPAVQIKNQLHPSASYNRVIYMSEILKNLRNKLTQ